MAIAVKNELKQKKYTAKELTKIAGTHDVFHCGQADCKTCKAYWQYAKGLREQSDNENKQKRVKKLAENRIQTSIVIPSNVHNGAIRKLVTEYGDDIAYYIDKGFSIRRIAYELDHNDAEIAQALNYLKLSPKTRSELNIEAYKSKLKTLVHEGLSIKAIAKRLNKKSAQSISSYLHKYDLPVPKLEKVTVDRIAYKDGEKTQYRYFDNNGDEIEIKPKEKTR